MTHRTDRYLRVEQALGENLAAWVYRWRQPDMRPPASWRTIAARLSEQTGIEVSHETLRDWFSDDANLLPVEPAGGRP